MRARQKKAKAAFLRSKAREFERWFSSALISIRRQELVASKRGAKPNDE